LEFLNGINLFIDLLFFFLGSKFASLYYCHFYRLKNGYTPLKLNSLLVLASISGLRVPCSIDCFQHFKKSVGVWDFGVINAKCLKLDYKKFLYHYKNPM